MQARDFCFWMQGFVELTDHGRPLTAEQMEIVRTHLALVFKHDPTMAHEAPPQNQQHVTPFGQAVQPWLPAQRPALYC